jgi:glycerophosphoryl diester phosphodiesterase
VVAPAWIECRFHRYVDRLYARLPQQVPSQERLQSCKIVSHRGEYDNRRVLENTLAAFDAVQQHGVWGIEFDLRWTSDLHPVVFHDQDCRRLFHTPIALREMTWKQLRARFPLIPSLPEVIQRYGKKMHLMVELKQEPYPDLSYQSQVLADLLSGLIPRQDYHFLSLDLEMFRRIFFVPGQACLPVAQLNVGRLSRTALQESYGGIAGHYLLLSHSLIRRHQQHQQEVGTGFIASHNCLCRELNRGVQWLFSNRAVALQRIRDNLLGAAKKKPGKRLLPG